MWLNQNKVDFQERDLIGRPLNERELKQLAVVGGLRVQELINSRSQVFKKMNIDLNSLDEKGALRIALENPRVLTRPVLTGTGVYLAGFNESEWESLVK